jgi:hypothetical protein
MATTSTVWPGRICVQSGRLPMEPRCFSPFCSHMSRVIAALADCLLAWLDWRGRKPLAPRQGRVTVCTDVQTWLNQAVASSGDLPLRMEVEVGALDRRLTLAPCAQVEPYLPAGSRLWGKTRVGLRCVQGSSEVECIFAHHGQGVWPGLGCQGSARFWRRVVGSLT